jgi:hypothetical protein
MILFGNHDQGIYLVYPWYIHWKGIYQVYTRYIPFQVKSIYLVYTRYNFSESSKHIPGIHLVYTWFIPANLKPSEPRCRRIAIGMQRHTDFGLPGSLISITARGAPTGHPSALAGTGAPPPTPTPTPTHVGAGGGGGAICLGREARSRREVPYSEWLGRKVWFISKRFVIIGSSLEELHDSIRQFAKRNVDF